MDGEGSGSFLRPETRARAGRRLVLWAAAEELLGVDLGSHPRRYTAQQARGGPPGGSRVRGTEGPAWAAGSRRINKAAELCSAQSAPVRPDKAAPFVLPDNGFLSEAPSGSET